MRQLRLDLIRGAHGLRDLLLNESAIALSHSVDLQPQSGLADAELFGDVGVGRGVVTQREEFAELPVSFEIVGLVKVSAQFFLRTTEHTFGPCAVEHRVRVADVCRLVRIAVLG